MTSNKKKLNPASVSLYNVYVFGARVCRYSPCSCIHGGVIGHAWVRFVGIQHSLPLPIADQLVAHEMHWRQGVGYRACMGKMSPWHIDCTAAPCQMHAWDLGARSLVEHMGGAIGHAWGGIDVGGRSLLVTAITTTATQGSIMPEGFIPPKASSQWAANTGFNDSRPR